jgi:glycosyltransferase involved in cell wall biosynthesis
MNVSLAIVVPTYNRAHILPRLLDYFKKNHHLISHLGVKIVFSNNHSTDNTAMLLSDFAAESAGMNLRIISPPEFLGTGEENMLWACSQVDSEYVWLIADDDLPSRDALREIHRVIRSRKYELCILNACYTEDLIGSLPAALSASYPVSSGIVFSGEDVVANVFELAANLGPINLFCNFSGLIFRRQKFLDSARFFYELELTTIYSHVFALLDAFSDASCIFLCRPLISIDTAYSDGHWDKLASRCLVSRRYFWHAGLHKKIDAFKKKNPHFAEDLDNLISRAIMPSGSCMTPNTTGFMLPQLIDQLFLDLNDDLYSSRDGFLHLCQLGILDSMEYYFGLLRFIDKIHFAPFSMMKLHLLDLRVDLAAVPNGWNRVPEFQSILHECWKVVTSLTCRFDKILAAGLLPAEFPALDFTVGDGSLVSLCSSVQEQMKSVKSPSLPIALRVGTRVSFIDGNRLSCQSTIEAFHASLMASW